MSRYHDAPDSSPTAPSRTMDRSSEHRGHVVAVTSGKGGVGKTNLVVNLAATLAEFDASVILIDADYGLGNVDLLLGLDADHTIEPFLRGQLPLSEVLLEGPCGFSVIAAPKLSELPKFRQLCNGTAVG